ncbi:MAG: ArsR family transcriptional regulator [Candidatus Thorarchaeota archaeon]|nr:ArsR family transcriptional regulator [Candidatus Thorarchaeota archaeon]
MSADDVFDAIAHPMRIEILKALAKKSLGFADLKRKLGISSSGQLDFHLKKMTLLVTTDSYGMYTLTSKGYAALYAIVIVSRHGWQRRSFFANLGMMFVVNMAFLIAAIDLLPVSLALTIPWILFYSYWTFVKRKVRLRDNGELQELQ